MGRALYLSERFSSRGGHVSFVTLKRFVAAGLMGLVFGIAAAAPTAAQDEARRLKTKVAPIYPELARKMNVTGIVKVQVTIAANGTVKNAKVVGGHPLLVDPAMDAVRKWKFEPGPEDSTQVVECRFDNNN